MLEFDSDEYWEAKLPQDAQDIIKRLSPRAIYTSKKELFSLLHLGLLFDNRKRVLFEVLCGRLCSIKHHDGLFLLATLAKDYYEKKKLVELIDPRLWEQMRLETMNKFSEIAYKCLHNIRGQRPSMDLVGS